MDKQRAIPSMYHRRLTLLACLMMFIMLLLGAQLARLSVVEGAQRRARAEGVLHRRTHLPAYRGGILDRQGRQIAVHRPGYAIAIQYGVITGAWERKQARWQAYRELGRTQWSEMTEPQRNAAADPLIPGFQAHRERLLAEVCRLGGIDADELDRRFDAIKRRVQRARASHQDRQRTRELTRYGGDEADFAFDPEPIVEEQSAHVVLPEVSDEIAFAFRTLAGDLPDQMLEVIDARRRDYPWSVADVRVDRSSLPRPLRSDRPITVRVVGVADHMLGSMRDVQREDIEARPFTLPDGTIDLKGYRAVNDAAGERGLERVFEEHLRGTRGESRRRIDTGAVVRTDPIPGDDFRTTLDISLQAHIQALLAHETGLTIVHEYHRNPGLPPGWPLNSAAVVLEVETGEILAMVSMPTRAMGAHMSPEERLLDNPYVNRPAEAIYPPGSIIKPLVLSAAVTDGKHDPAASITCTGHYFSHIKTLARCWIYRARYGYATHGEVHPEDAIAQSCNIFFYTLADRLGVQRLTDWYRRFGMDTVLDVGLAHEHVTVDAAGETRTRIVGEAAGMVLDDEMINRLRADGSLRFESIILGIGQGNLAWTPIQAANAYATLARGGSVRDATLVADDPRGTREARCADLNLDRRAVDAALEGLRRAVTKGGTGYQITYAPGDSEPIFNAQAVTVWGKTGTAQAPPLRLRDTNGDGVINSRDDVTIDKLDHAWFVGLVGPNDTQRPMFAIAVIVEYGGSGGRVAGPIANQIIHALQEQGYLPGAAQAQARANP